MATIHRKNRLVRRRRRAGERGAAMTEAVVAIPFFLLLTSSILFVGKMYETKLRVMRATRQSAWSYAMCNCGEAGDSPTTSCKPGDPGAAATPGGPMGGAPAGYDPSSLGKGGKGPGASVATKDYGTSKASGSAKVVSDVFLTGFSKEMKSETHVMCNEAPHNGDLKGWLTSAFDAFTSW